ncbi:MAG: DciA family protein [Alphaproteobacteria bacterium]
MRPLSEATARIAGKSFERKYIALGRIVNNWRDIVGAQLADKAQPVKIHYRKKTGEKQPQATLEIAASSADATLLHYQKDLILERINQIFGESWISAIRFVHVASNMQGKAPKKPKAPLTADEKKTLSDMLLEIEDGDMRARLERLGRSIIMDAKS